MRRVAQEQLGFGFGAAEPVVLPLPVIQPEPEPVVEDVQTAVGPEAIDETPAPAPASEPDPEPEPELEPDPEPELEAPTPGAPVPANPPLKYPGGKAKLAPTILPFLGLDDRRDSVLVEPFVGAGAVSLLALARGFRGTLILADADLNIMALWETLYREPEALKDYLRTLPTSEITEVEYLIRRERFRHVVSPIERAGLLLWLNKTNYNGLHRYSKKAGYNAHWGKYTTWNLTAALATVDRCHALLSRALLVKFFDDAIPALAHSGSWDRVSIYVDSPYLGGFAGYTAAGFKRADHDRLSNTLRGLPERVRIVLSHVDNAAADEVYGWMTKEVIGEASRQINRDGAGRGKVVEVVFCSSAVGWEGAP